MRPFTIEDVVYAAQAASILEVSVDKPGNVGPSHDFDDTSYVDFIMSGLAMGRAVKGAVEFGMLHEQGERGTGAFIKQAVWDGQTRTGARNTNLGIAMLMIPLSVSCGISIKQGSFTLRGLRNGLKDVIEGSTAQDVLDLYEAIRLSNAEVGRSNKFDVKDPRSRERVMEKGLNLHDIFEHSKWDTIARELITGMEVTFTIGFPSLKREFELTGDIRQAILRCFFEILAVVPDTLIERKNDRAVAEEVSKEARVILEKGMRTKDVQRFDGKLRSKDNKYNPGTTADLTAASIMIALLHGCLQRK